LTQVISAIALLFIAADQHGKAFGFRNPIKSLFSRHDRACCLFGQKIVNA